jgi:hypothetical protein
LNDIQSIKSSTDNQNDNNSIKSSDIEINKLINDCNINSELYEFKPNSPILNWEADTIPDTIICDLQITEDRYAHDLATCCNDDYDNNIIATSNSIYDNNIIATSNSIYDNNIIATSNSIYDNNIIATSNSIYDNNIIATSNSIYDNNIIATSNSIYDNNIITNCYIIPINLEHSNESNV